MSGTGHGEGRIDAFMSERLATGADALTAHHLAPGALAEQRCADLAEFRGRKAAAAPAVPSLAAVPAPGRNWIPLGPFAVLRGQAANEPVVSGRVAGIAVSNDGQRIFVASGNGGVWRSVDQGRSWLSMSDEFDVDPPNQNVDSLSCGAVAVVDGGTVDQDVLYVGTGERDGTSDAYFGVGPIVSTDGGATWQREAQSPANSLMGRGFFQLAVDPANPDLVVGATSRGLYRRDVVPTTTWQRISTVGVAATGAGVQSPTRSFSSVVAVRDGALTRYFAARHSGLIYTWDTSQAPGANWTELGAASFPTANVGRISLAVGSAPNVAVYALIAQPSNSDSLLGMWRLDLSDTTWRKVSDVPDDLFGEDGFQGSYDQAIVVDPNNPDVVYVGGSTRHAGGEWSGNIYRLSIATEGSGAARTYEADATYIGASTHADIHALVTRPGHSNELWVGCDGGVFHTMNATGSGNDLFEARNVGLNILTPNSLTAHPTQAGYFFSGVQDQGGCRFTGDEVWLHQLPGDGGDTVIDWNNNADLLSIYTNETVRGTTLSGSRYSYSNADVPLYVDSTPALSETTSFYSPMVGVPPDGNATHARRVAFGSQRPWISDDFGGTWKSIPTGVQPGGLNAQAVYNADNVGSLIRSLAFATHTRLYVGTRDGRLIQYDQTAPGWNSAVHGTAHLGFPITSITVDPADATNASVYLTIGGTGAGTRVVHWNGTTFAPRSTGLIDVQHNSIAVDPSNAQTLYVAADIGVWTSPDAGANWAPFSNGLPDSAVLDLDLHQPSRRLRATLHGRGVWEMPLDGQPQPAVEAYLRTNVLDSGRGAVPIGATIPHLPDLTTDTHPSPDILVDAPNDRGEYRFDPAEPVDIVQFAAAFSSDMPSIVANVPETVVTTRVHVQVRNRSRFPADDLQVMLLLGKDAEDGTPPALPGGFEGNVAAGTTVDTADWKTVGVRTVDGVVAGTPKIVTFDLRSDLVPPASESAGERYVLLAMLHSAPDAFTATNTDVNALVTADRRSAIRHVNIRAAGGAAVSGGVVGGTGDISGAGPISESAGRTGPSVLIPVATALLAHKRLSDVVEGLERRINTHKVDPNLGGFGSGTTDPRAVERQVLALASAARDMFEAGPSTPPNRNVALSGIGSFPMLGAVGLEIPALASVFAPGGDWVSDAMRRRTPDPQRSLISVPSAEFALDVGRLGIAKADDPEDRARIRATTMGLLAATSAGVVVGPQLRDLFARETNRDWGRWAASGGAAAADELIRRRLFPGRRPDEIIRWWPSVDQVPDALWEGYLEALTSAHRLPDGRLVGFADHDFEEGEWLNPARLRNAYAMLRNNLGSSSWPWPAWWGILTPIMLGPPITMLAGLALPNAGKFFTPGVPLDEHAFFELLTLGMGVGSVTPFVYSMILWGLVGDFHEPFVTALAMFIARGVFTGVGLGTDPSPLVRWLGMYTPMVGIDVYAATRSIVAAANDRPGPSFVFGLQTLPAITSIATLIISGIAKAAVDKADDTWPYWLVWAIATAGLWLGLGIGLAVPLSHGGGFWSWFMRDDRRIGLADAVKAAAAEPVDPIALARVFETAGLWVDPQTAPTGDPGIEHHAYPSGMRGLVRLWRDGDDAVEIANDDAVVRLRPTGQPETRVPFESAGETSVELAGKLDGAVDGLRAEPIGPDDPQYRLPWPFTVADPGDDGPLIDHATAKDRFVPLPDSEDDAYILRHSPRIQHAAAVGLNGDLHVRVDAFPVVPYETLGDLEGTGLGAAADLTVLLAMASAPTLAASPVEVDDGLPDLPADSKELQEVSEVFRRWNLDERRLNEWRMLVAGRARSEKLGDATSADPLMRPRPAAHAAPDPDAGEQLATAMGWIPMWRAWLRMASDPAADTTAGVAMPYTPEFTTADGTRRRASNGELSEGVRYLLELRG